MQKRLMVTEQLRGLLQHAETSIHDACDIACHFHLNAIK